jgi:hypothetical protein
MQDVWIGSQYSALSNRILILGESTYGDDPPLSTYLPQWISRAVRDTTFARVFNACSGNHTSRASVSDRDAFWANVAFYNFVIDRLSTRQSRPKLSHYQKAAGPFLNLLESMRPRGVLILGSEQAQHSAHLVAECGILSAIAPHPTSWGLRTQVITDAWNSLTP